MKKKVVVITGPTAVGKSDFAVEHAIKNNGEVISADSRQVYKGMDIGTGKISIDEMKGIPHHLLDVVEPSESFNVEKYKILAQKVIDDITSRGKLPIICGGTGFYIDALIYNISYPHVEHDFKLREELSKMDSDELFNTLKKYDPKYAEGLNNSERNNTQRLIRSIEIAKEIGEIPKLTKSESPYDVEWINLSLPSDELKERIYRRLIKRIDNGMIEEVEALHRKGLSWERMEEFGLEYRYVSRFLRNLITKEEMIEKLKNEIWHYAKRQMLWFKRYK